VKGTSEGIPCGTIPEMVHPRKAFLWKVCYGLFRAIAVKKEKSDTVYAPPDYALRRMRLVCCFEA